MSSDIVCELLTEKKKRMDEQEQVGNKMRGEEKKEGTSQVNITSGEKKPQTEISTGSEKRRVVNPHPKFQGASRFPSSGFPSCPALQHL